MFPEVGLICIHHAVQPWQQLLRAVVGVEDDWDAVGGGDAADVVGGGHGAGNGGLLLVVLDTL